MSLRVLLIDDHDDLRAMLTLMLEYRGGHQVQNAASGEQALAAAREFRPELVISDITMPGMDGFQLLEQMKSQDFGPFKSIALSGHELPESEDSATRFDAYLQKPVDFDQLFETINQLKDDF